MNADDVSLYADYSGFFGWIVRSEVVPMEYRCWKCDVRRTHDRCAAGLCDECCAELRAASAA